MGVGMRLCLASVVLLLFGVNAAFANPNLVSSTLPTARSVTVGDSATFFATVINAGDMDATDCKLAFITSNLVGANNFSGTFSYQTVDAANTLTGTPNTSVTIPAGATQGFIFSLTPDKAFTGNVKIDFKCGTALTTIYRAPVQPGINDVFLTATEPGLEKPDPIATLATPSADGALRITAAGGIEAAAGSVLNIRGNTTTVRATPRVAFNPKGASLSICETDSSGQCLAPAAPFVDMTIGSVANTYTIFADASDTIGMAFLPNLVRLFVDFSEPGGAFLSGTSVALTAPMPALAQNPQFPSGYYRTQIRYKNDEQAEKIQNGYVLIDVDGSVFGVTEWTIDGPQGRHANQVFEGVGAWSAAEAPQGASPKANPPANKIFTGTSRYYLDPDTQEYVLKSVSFLLSTDDFSSLSGALRGDPSFQDDPSGPQGDTANVMLEALLLLATPPEPTPPEPKTVSAKQQGRSGPLVLSDATYTLVDAAKEGDFDPNGIGNARLSGLTGNVSIVGTALSADVTYTGEETCNLSATIGAQINQSNIYRLPTLTVAGCTTGKLVNAPGDYEGFLIFNEVNPATTGDNVRLILLKKDRAFSFALLGAKN